MKRVSVSVSVAVLCASLISSATLGAPPNRDEEPTTNSLKSRTSKVVGKLRSNVGLELDKNSGPASFRAAKSPERENQRPEAGRESRAKTAGPAGLLAANAPALRSPAKSATGGANVQRNRMPAAFARNSATSPQVAGKQSGDDAARSFQSPGAAAEIDKSL
jgi:hypothetical protein